jgi:peptidylprolyl isomerase
MRNLRSSLALATAALTIASVLTGCTTDGGAPEALPEAVNSTLPTVSDNAGDAPVISTPNGAPPTELVIEDVIVGTGREASLDSTVTVHYTLMAWSNGQVLESSWGQGPATFPLSNLIPGWQEGIPGMKEGGRRLLVIPPDKGYGPAGQGSVGPNETLVFAIDLLAIS